MILLSGRVPVIDRVPHPASTSTVAVAWGPVLLTLIADPWI